MTTYTVTEARANLRSILDGVKGGDEVVLTQHGEAVAVIVHPSQLSARRSPAVKAAAAWLHRLEDTSRRRPERGAGLSALRADQLVAELRERRDEE